MTDSEQIARLRAQLVALAGAVQAKLATVPPGQHQADLRELHARIAALAAGGGSAA